MMNCQKASNFGKNLKAFLIHINLSQADFARLAGLTPAAISLIISGQRDPTLSTIEKILDALPFTLDQLLSDSFAVD